MDVVFSPYISPDKSALGFIRDDARIVCCTEGVKAVYGDTIPTCTPETYGRVMIANDSKSKDIAKISSILQVRSLSLPSQTVTIRSVPMTSTASGHGSMSASMNEGSPSSSMNAMDAMTNGAGMNINSNMGQNDAMSDASLLMNTHTVELSTESLRFDSIAQSGPWSVSLITCDTNLLNGFSNFIDPTTVSSLTISSNGKAMWHAYNGYLPARLYPSWSFFSVLTLCYSGMLLFWGITLSKYFNHLSGKLYHVQKTMLLLLFTSILYTISLYYSFVRFHETGTPDAPAQLLVSLLEATRGTILRWLVLVIAIGYGVAYPSMRHVKGKLQIFCGLNCFFDFTKSLIYLMHQGGSDTYLYAVIITVVMMAFDTTFFAWTYQSSLVTLSHLRAKQQVSKVVLYNHFLRGIYLCAGCSVIFLLLLSLFGGYFYHILWRAWWVVQYGYFELLYLALIGSIAFLWRPSMAYTIFGSEYLQLSNTNPNQSTKPKTGLKSVTFRRHADDPAHDNVHETVHTFSSVPSALDDDDNEGQEDIIEEDEDMDMDVEIKPYDGTHDDDQWS